MTYRREGKVAYIGIGIREGDRFAMSWSNPRQVGITVYRIEKGPKLVGQFTQLGGIGILARETLTREKEL